MLISEAMDCKIPKNNLQNDVFLTLNIKSLPTGKGYGKIDDPELILISVYQLERTLKYVIDSFSLKKYSQKDELQKDINIAVKRFEIKNKYLQYVDPQGGMWKINFRDVLSKCKELNFNILENKINEIVDNLIARYEIQNKREYILDNEFLIIKFNHLNQKFEGIKLGTKIYNFQFDYNISYNDLNFKQLNKLDKIIEETKSKYFKGYVNNLKPNQPLNSIWR